MGSSSSRLKREKCDEPRTIPAIPLAKPLSNRISPFALLICIGYLLSAAFYFYTRIVYTLDTGDYAWYSKFILAVEFLGISALLPYAFMIVRGVFTNGTPGLPKGELGDVQQPWFTVHVLIPCYSEPIEVIAKTTEAALAAPVPPNCEKKVYVCDDGKKAVTQTFVQTKRNPNLFYVSNRARKNGEKNGKSANLNNCLQNVIFSTFKNAEGIIDATAAKDIPLSEVVVVFDCDMICKPNFFLKILEVMVDDRLALCLTPQSFSNIDEYIDLFNNINTQFWQYILPGSVAAGYIACTGTNFCIRARALAAVGWFPEYTITEDYALGMELAQHGYKGTYLNEYLAVGEAPDEIRNVMRQRSRWTKGHMEVFFSKRCPLLNYRLSCINRLLYTNGTWAYFVTVITTPIFLAVPLISLVFGIHPVAVTREFALAAVIYFGFTFMIQWYFRDYKHMVSLWFSNISNHVLCFTYFKAIFNTLLAIFGCKAAGGFKVTKKKAEKKSDFVKALEAMAQKTRTMVRSMSKSMSRRRSHDEDRAHRQQKAPMLPPIDASPDEEEEEDDGCCGKFCCPNAGDLENTMDTGALFVSFSVSAAAIALGIYQAITMKTFEVYTTLPIFWAAYNIIPPTLFLWYCFTKGPTFKMLCSFARLFGVLCGIGALVSLWFAQEREPDAKLAVSQSALYLAVNQAGVVEPGTDFIAPWVVSNGLKDGQDLDYGLDLSGGFYVDGSSNVKYNHPLGVAVSMLAWGFVEFGQGIAIAGQETNYRAFFRHAGLYFSKLWVRDRNHYITRVGDPEIDGQFIGVPPKDIDTYVSMLRPVYRVNQTKPGVVWGMDAISSGVAALAASSVVLRASPDANDKALGDQFRKIAIDMWATMDDGESRTEVTGTTYCYDESKGVNICLSRPKNTSACFINWNGTSVVDRAPPPPPTTQPPPPSRQLPGGRRSNRKLFEHADRLMKDAAPMVRELLQTTTQPLPRGPPPPTPPWPPQPPSPPWPPEPPQPQFCNYTLQFKDDNYYNSTSVYDDAAWAAAWLFRAAEDDAALNPDEYAKAADYWLLKHFDFEGSWKNASYYITNYNNIQWAASLIQMQNKRRQLVDFRESRAANYTNTYFRAWLGRLNIKNMDDYDLSVAYPTPGGLYFSQNTSVPSAATTAMMAMQLSKILNNRFAVKNLRCWARGQLRYILGLPQRATTNIKTMFKPVSGQSFLTGYGNDYPRSIADRAAACPREGATCGPTTWGSDAPNPNNAIGALVNGPDDKDRFVDTRANWGSHVGLLNNMGFNGLAAAFMDPSTKITGPQCQEDRGLWDKLFNQVEFY